MVFFALPPTLLGQVARSGLKRLAERPTTWSDWIMDPRNSVLAVLVLALVVGGGWRLVQAHRARRAVARLSDPDVTPDEVNALAEFGREGLEELFRLLEPDVARPLREAAGATLAVLWAGDHLIPEEERAIVTRGYEVHWQARRRYPRSLRVPIPVNVTFGVPFLKEEGPGVRPSNLEWSYRVLGAERASLERFHDWQPGPGRLAFTLEPGDFDTNGPHRLTFQARARTVGLTSSWELDLPHIPFNFEFDPRLTVESLLSLPDADRAAKFARALALESPEIGEQTDPRFLPLNDQLALRNPPDLVVTDPPGDLAHAAALEFEGQSDRLPCGPILVSRDRLAGSPARFPLTLEPVRPAPAARPSRRGPRPPPPQPRRPPRLGRPGRPLPLARADHHGLVPPSDSPAAECRCPILRIVRKKIPSKPNTIGVLTGV